MILYGRNGEEFSLLVIDYEFPDIVDDEWDSNWLLIETKAKLEGKSWAVIDPCLLTWEVLWLVNWLEAISYGDLSIDEVNFLEPNLHFRLEGHKNKQIVIGVFFELENKPKWLEATGEDEVFIDLNLSPEKIYAWVNELKKQRHKFPPRAGVSTQRDIRKKE